MSLTHPQEFLQRRQRLLQMLDPSALCIVAAAPHYKRNNDTEYLYRQDSDFYYLTGFTEPEAIAVFAPNFVEGEYLLFVRENNSVEEKWAGPRAGLLGACRDYAADAAFAISEFEEKLASLLVGREHVYYPYGRYAGLDEQIKRGLQEVRHKARSGTKIPDTIGCSDALLSELRLIKSEFEIQLMRRAAEISAAAHCRAMQVCHPGMFEYELEAELIYEFIRHGSRAPAYNTIVGGGVNACILHYIENNQVLRSGDLVLIDAGAEYQYYAADITRTFPVNGRFNPEQRALYELVLAAQTAALAEIKPGTLWNHLQTVVIQVLTQGLIDLGLLNGERDDLIASKAYQDFYFHGCSHWLGIDVHDVGSYFKDNQYRALQAGMTLTIEPGLYIAADNMQVAAKWRGIGIRIEDDVLVTAQGHEVLTQAVPKTIADIEALMAE